MKRTLRSLLRLDRIGPITIMCLLILSVAAIAQSFDPMRPPPGREPVIPPGEKSLAAEILAALVGDIPQAERVSVLKIRRDQVAAVLEELDRRNAQQVQIRQPAELRGQDLVIRSNTGDERVFSPHPLVLKTPRPVGSPPSDRESVSFNGGGEPRG